MDVFLMIRRKKASIFIDAKESTSVLDLKKMIMGITKKAPNEMRLYKDETQLDDMKTLGDSGFTSSTARAQSPGTIGVVFKNTDGSFEQLDITTLSVPPELPEVMKPAHDGMAHAEPVAS